MTIASNVLRALVASLAVFGCLSATGRPQANLDGLFARLESPATTDTATKELIRRGRSDPAARKYLASRIPALILGGTREGEVWRNAISIAGELKIAEATDALCSVIIGRAGTLSPVGWIPLDDSPAAEALVKIGDPAVPSLTRILAGKDHDAREWAVAVLDNIHSRAASKALEEDLRHESDQAVRKMAQDSLRRWKKGPTLIGVPMEFQ